VKLIIDCDCGTKTVVEVGEPLFCKKCGGKPIFRYTNVGFYRFEGTFLAEKAEQGRSDFLMFKRLLFQVRDKAIDERSYLCFLAGYFSIIPTEEDLKIPKEGHFKIKTKEV
jgi:hypothetical protein